LKKNTQKAIFDVIKQIISKKIFIYLIVIIGVQNNILRPVD